ncbi:MAG: peroxiredoxin-like family protein [Pirellulales bacterium]
MSVFRPFVRGAAVPAAIAALAVASVARPSLAADAGVAQEAQATKPVAAGSALPDVAVKSVDGADVRLSSLHQKGPVVLVFFRGGWCPICTKHTAELIKVLPQIKSAGATLVGVSPDDPAHSQANASKNSIPFPLFSDSDVAAAKAFGLAFHVDDETVKKYKGFGIDLDKASGRDHHVLPVPAVYIVDRSGKIVFAHSNPDYRQRLDAAQIVAELKKLK